MATTYYFLPTRNLFGEDSVQETGALMQSLGGKKTMIVTDSFLASSGMAADVQEILKNPTWKVLSLEELSQTQRIQMLRVVLRFSALKPATPLSLWVVVLPTTVRKLSDWLHLTVEISVIMKVSINLPTQCVQ